MTQEKPSPDEKDTVDRGGAGLSRAIARHLRSNVVGYVALFVALTGGTAYALNGSNTVFSDDIVNGEVKSADVENLGIAPVDLSSNSVGTAKIINGGVGTSDLAGSTVTSGKVHNESLRDVDIKDGTVGLRDLAPLVRPGPGARARATVAQSFATNDLTLVHLNAEDHDTGNMYTPPADTLTAHAAGTYLITGTVIFAGGGGSSRQVNLDVNGTSIAVASGTPSTSSMSVNPTGIAELDVGDVISMRAFQNSGGNLGTVNNTDLGRAFLAAQRLGP